MMKSMFTAAVAVVLMAGAAHAQTTQSAVALPPLSTPDASPKPMDSTATSSMSTTTAAPTPAAMAPSAANSTDASAVVTVNTVTNGPVADTPENRAKYGQPMSRAGKRTAPKGN